MPVHDPFARLPEAASSTVTSTSTTDGAAGPPEQHSAGLSGGKDISPQLSWSGAPEGTKSFAVTVYHPGAPTGSGFRHRAVADIPATGVPADAAPPCSASPWPVTPSGARC